MFFDDLISENDADKLEKLRSDYASFSTNLEKTLTQLDNLEATLFNME